MEGMEGDSGEGGGVRALEKVANKLSVFLNECRNIQVRLGNNNSSTLSLLHTRLGSL